MRGAMGALTRCNNSAGVFRSNDDEEEEILNEILVMAGIGMVPEA